MAKNSANDVVAVKVELIDSDSEIESGKQNFWQQII